MAKPIHTLVGIAAQDSETASEKRWDRYEQPTQICCRSADLMRDRILKREQTRWRWENEQYSLVVSRACTRMSWLGR